MQTLIAPSAVKIEDLTLDQLEEVVETMTNTLSTAARTGSHSVQEIERGYDLIEPFLDRIFELKGIVIPD